MGVTYSPKTARCTCTFGDAAMGSAAVIASDVPLRVWNEPPRLVAGSTSGGAGVTKRRPTSPASAISTTGISQRSDERVDDRVAADRGGDDEGSGDVAVGGRQRHKRALAGRAADPASHPASSTGQGVITAIPAKTHVPIDPTTSATSGAARSAIPRREPHRRRVGGLADPVVRQLGVGAHEESEAEGMSMNSTSDCAISSGSTVAPGTAIGTTIGA